MSGFSFKFSGLQIKTEVSRKVFGISLTNLQYRHSRNFMHFQKKSVLSVRVPIILFLALRILVILYVLCQQNSLYFLSISIYRPFTVFLFMQQPDFSVPVSQGQRDCSPGDRCRFLHDKSLLLYCRDPLKQMPFLTSLALEEHIHRVLCIKIRLHKTAEASVAKPGNACFRELLFQSTPINRFERLMC